MMTILYLCIVHRQALHTSIRPTKAYDCVWVAYMSRGQHESSTWLLIEEISIYPKLALGLLPEQKVGSLSRVMRVILAGTGTI